MKLKQSIFTDVKRLKLDMESENSTDEDEINMEVIASNINN